MLKRDKILWLYFRFYHLLRGKGKKKQLKVT